MQPLFLHPDLETRREVGLLIPEINESLCTYWGMCAEVCQFHAIAVIGKKTLVFPQLCHGCGSCTLVCPEHAISERLDVMGVLESGPAAGGIDFAQGIMNVGEPMAVPIIRELKKWERTATVSLRAPNAKQSSSLKSEIASKAPLAMT
jgi:MinD superfamily P-loop ATPase